MFAYAAVNIELHFHIFTLVWIPSTTEAALLEKNPRRNDFETPARVKLEAVCQETKDSGVFLCEVWCACAFSIDFGLQMMSGSEVNVFKVFDAVEGLCQELFILHGLALSYPCMAIIYQ